MTKKEQPFQFYHLPYLARWAINLRRWQLEPGGKEFDFLLSRLDSDEVCARILAHKRWADKKLALAKELAVRRMVEIMTQAMWHKVKWRHDQQTGRDFLVDREQYVWTGQKYQNANVRFPNFNFSIVEAGDYLFLVSHPVALTGLYAGGPPTDDLPDPCEAFAQELAAARGEAEAAEATKATEAVEGALEEDPAEDQQMLGQEELVEICSAESVPERQLLLRQALVAKFAYFRTMGRCRGRAWSKVSLCCSPVDSSSQGALEPEENWPGAPRRHHLHVNGQSQKRWRCDVHSWKGYCIVVCRAPPEEAEDPLGDFKGTQTERFLEIDTYDNVLNHTEPPFIEVPIQQLLPEKWHSDYIRACGGGERGERTRMNYLGKYAVNVPKV